MSGGTDNPALVLVGVPSAVIDLDHLNTDIGLDQPGGLREAAGEFVFRIFSAGLVSLCRRFFDGLDAINRGLRGFGEKFAGGVPVFRERRAIGVFQRGAHGDVVSFRHAREAEVRNAVKGKCRGLAAKNAGQVISNRNRPHGPMAFRGHEVAVQPTVRTHGIAGDAGFPRILLFKMGAGIEIVADRMESAGLTFRKERLDRGSARIQTKIPIQINDAVRLAGLGELQGFPQALVGRVGVGNDEVQAIHPAAEEDHDKGFAFVHRLGGSGCAKESGRGKSAVEGEGTGGFQEVTAGDIHMG